MRNVLVDAGPLLASLDKGDRRHAWAISEITRLRGRFATVWPAVAEAAYLLGRRGPAAATGLLESLAANEVEVAPMGRDDFAALSYLMTQYDDLPMDLADAALVHAYQRDGYDAVMTTDRRDFSIYRVAGKPLRTITPRD